MKTYNDGRQVRIVKECAESTVELSAIGPIIERVPYVKFKGLNVTEVGYRYKRKGFGRVNGGTGVFISNKGLILTCYHVTRGSKLIEVSLEGFNTDSLTPKPPRKVFATVIGVDEDNDLALLKVIYPGQWYRPVSLRETVEIGLSVFTIGFPQYFQKYTTHGIISNFEDGWTYSDIVIYHGSSGGGLFDINGKLVGLADGMHFPADYLVYQGFSIFTTLDSMHKLIDKYEGF